MSNNFEVTLFETLRVILRPIVRYCLKHSMGVRDLLDAARHVFVSIAVEELEKAEKKTTTSRISVMTGLQRPLIKACRKNPDPAPPSHFTTRVISQWRRDPRFLTKSKAPKVLSYEGHNTEFKKLVEAVSTDLHPRTVLFDLERLGVVEITNGGVKLKARAYRPAGKPSEVYRMMARDVEELMRAVIENIEHEAEGKDPVNFHAYTYFDNVSAEDLTHLRKWLSKQGSRFHQRVERYLSKYDLDVTPNKDKRGGHRIAMGSFCRAE